LRCRPNNLPFSYQRFFVFLFCKRLSHLQTVFTPRSRFPPSGSPFFFFPPFGLLVSKEHRSLGSGPCLLCSSWNFFSWGSFCFHLTKAFFVFAAMSLCWQRSLLPVAVRFSPLSGGRGLIVLRLRAEFHSEGPRSFSPPAFPLGGTVLLSDFLSVCWPRFGTFFLWICYQSFLFSMDSFSYRRQRRVFLFFHEFSFPLICFVRAFSPLLLFSLCARTKPSSFFSPQTLFPFSFSLRRCVYLFRLTPAILFLQRSIFFSLENRSSPQYLYARPSWSSPASTPVFFLVHFTLAGSSSSLFFF